MKDLTYEELTNELYNYIRDNYDYEHCDNFGDELVFTLENGKQVYITINIDKGEVI